jgi:hypothetical protein
MDNAAAVRVAIVLFCFDKVKNLSRRVEWVTLASFFSRSKEEEKIKFYIQKLYD